MVMTLYTINTIAIAMELNSPACLFKKYISHSFYIYTVYTAYIYL